MGACLYMYIIFYVWTKNEIGFVSFWGKKSFLHKIFVEFHKKEIGTTYSKANYDQKSNFGIMSYWSSIKLEPSVSWWIVPSVMSYALKGTLSLRFLYLYIKDIDPLNTVNKVNPIRTGRGGGGVRHTPLWQVNVQCAIFGLNNTFRGWWTFISYVLGHV